MDHLHYCRDLARTHAYGEYCCLLLLPAEVRPRALALIALDVELRHVVGKVREEMLAHVRYAWWREHIANRATGHPVLKAIAEAHLPPEATTTLIDEAQASWPKTAPTHLALHTAVAALLSSDDRARWQRCLEIAEKHGEGRPWLLPFKLLFMR